MCNSLSVSALFPGWNSLNWNRHNWECTQSVWDQHLPQVIMVHIWAEWQQMQFGKIWRIKLTTIDVSLADMPKKQIYMCRPEIWNVHDQQRTWRAEQRQKATGTLCVQVCVCVSAVCVVLVNDMGICVCWLCGRVPMPPPHLLTVVSLVALTYCTFFMKVFV